MCKTGYGTGKESSKHLISLKSNFETLKFDLVAVQLVLVTISYEIY